MKKFFGLIFILSTSLFFLGSFNRPVSAAEELTLDVEHAIAIDVDSGKIFYEKDSDTVAGIASMTKLVSIYVLLDAVKEGKVKWEDPVAIPDFLIPLSQNWELSNVPLYAGTTYTVKDLYEASLIASANAGVMALAYHVAGSEEAFVTLMKEKLQSIGITDAKIVNSSGLNNTYLGENRVPNTQPDEENYMSAKDMAILGRHLLTDYPEILETTKQPTATFAPNTDYPYDMVNWNWMLPGLINYKEGVDGLKTGTTDIAGACFMGTLEKDGHRYLTVVMHANNHENDPSARFVETNKLMDYVLKHWSVTTFDPADFTLPKTKLPVEKGKVASVPLTLKDATAQSIWVKDQTAPAVTSEITPSVLTEDGSLAAPITKNLQVGKVTLSPADDLGYLEENDGPKLEMAIVTETGVEKANPFVLFGRSVVNFFKKIGDFFSHLFTVVNF